MIRRVLAVTAVLLSAGTIVRATDSFTIHLSNVTETVAVVNPCFGPMLGVLNYDGVVHVTESDNVFHAAIHVHGTATAFPLDPDIAPFSGAFNESDVLHLNRNQSSQSIVITQHDRGRTFHITFKVIENDSGLSMFIENFSCEA
jgi:hypothetical protein